VISEVDFESGVSGECRPAVCGMSMWSLVKAAIFENCERDTCACRMTQCGGV
jgi:hypothetical protein